MEFENSSAFFRCRGGGKDAEKSLERGAVLPMTGTLLLGIDLGTSGVKVGIYDPEGNLLGLGRSSNYTFYSPKPGWSQSDPELWWEDIIVSIRSALRNAAIKRDEIVGVGVSAFLPTVIPIGSDGLSLYPAILYNDQRSTGQVRSILEKISREEYQAIIGNVLVPGTCAVASMAWIRDEEPEVYKKSKFLCYANTYVTSRLTGQYYTDPTAVSSSGLVDIKSPRNWSEELCRRTSIDIRKLPKITEAFNVIGEVGRGAAESTGLKAGTPVVCGCGDVVASSFGAGALDPGSVVYVAGSTDCVTVPFLAPTKDRRWMNLAYIPENLWFGVGTSTSTGVSVDWFLRELLKERLDAKYAMMIELADSCAPGASGLLFLPYLQGERTPVWDPDARGVFLGISASTTRAQLARAVFEGTAFALRDIIQCLEEINATPIREIRAVGGGTKNYLWNQIKADVLQKSLDVLKFQETGSLGAALLAGIGTGIYKSCEQAIGVARGITGARTVFPDPGKKVVYNELFSIYKQAYQGIRSILHSLVEGTRK